MGNFLSKFKKIVLELNNLIVILDEENKILKKILIDCQNRNNGLCPYCLQNLNNGGYHDKSCILKNILMDE